MANFDLVANIRANTSGFESGMKRASSALRSLVGGTERGTKGIGRSMFGAQLAANAVSGAFRFVSREVGAMGDELADSSKAWTTFEGNMKQIGKSSGEIRVVKNELQDFAAKSIYSASDMATTYSQMTAIGYKGAEKLVKGMAGLAAASDNPKQAMKTLSTQMTQALTKPKLQWQDFKLMLEQSPAGMSAVAKEMGMSLDELVKGIQDGEIASKDFASAVSKVGTTGSFARMATEFKSTGEAMDGLREGLANKLLPTFQKLDKVAIQAISGISRAIEKINFDKMLDPLVRGFQNARLNAVAFFRGISKTNALQALGKAFDAVGKAISHVISAFTDVGGSAKEMGEAFGHAVEKVSDFAVKVADMIKSLDPSAIRNFSGGVLGAVTALQGLRIASPIMGLLYDLSGAFIGTSHSMVGFASSMGSKLNGSFNILGQGVKKTIGLFNTSLPQAFRTAKSGLETFALKGMYAMDGLKAQFPLVTGKVKTMSNNIGQSFGNMKNMVAPFTNKVKSSFGTVALTGMYAADKLKDSFETFALKGMYAVDVLRGRFPLLSGAVAGFGAMASSALGGFGGAISKVTSMFMLFGNIGAQTLGTTTQLIASLAGAGLAIVGPVAMVGALIAALGVAGTVFGEQITGMLEMAATQGPQIITNLANGIISAIPQLINNGVQIIQGLGNAIASNMPVIMQKGVQIIQALVQGVGSNIPQLLSTGIQIIATFVSGVIQALPQLALTGMQFILQLVQGVVQSIPQLLSVGMQLITQFISSITGALPQIISTGVQIIVTLIQGIAQNLPRILQMAVQIIGMLIQGIVQAVPQLLSAGVQIVVSLIQGIVQNLSSILAAAGQIIAMLIQGIAQVVPQLISAGVQIVVALIQGLIQAAPQLLEGARQLAGNVVNGIKEGIASFGSDMWSGLQDGWNSFWGGAEERSATGSQTISTNVGNMTTQSQSHIDNLSTNGAMSFDGLITSLIGKSGEASQGVVANMQGIEQAQMPIDLFATNADASLANLSMSLPTSANTAATGVNNSMNLLGQSHIPVDTFTNNAMASMDNFAINAPNSAMTATNGVVSNASGVSGSASYYEEAGSRMSEAMGTMSTNVNATMGNLNGTIATNVEHQMNTFTKGYQSGGQQVNSIMKSIASQIKSSMNSIKSAITSSMNSIKSTVTSSMNSIKSSVSSSMSSIKSTVTSGFNAVRSTIQSTMQSALATIRSTMQSAVAAMNSAAGQARAAGHNMGAGFLAGLSAMGGAIVAKAQSIASQAAAAMRSALRIHSPSRVTASIGNYTGQGFVNGLKSMVKPSEKMAGKLANAGIPDIDSRSITDKMNNLTAGKLDSQYQFSGGELSVNMPVIENTLILGGRKYDGFVEDITYRQASLEGMARY